MKTITISDEVYEKLSRLKGKRSFSEIIDLLLRTSVERRIDMLIKVGSFCTGREDELKAIVESIKEAFKTREFPSLSDINHRE
ncbi:MAG: antitoxin VapB family protein [Thermoproteota archaeon]|jgi:predicted CopG family antitoxin